MDTGEFLVTMKILFLSYNPFFFLSGRSCDIIEAVKDRRWANFDSTQSSFLTIDLASGNFSSTKTEQVIELTFKTERFNGLLFYQGEMEFVQRDYLIINLNDGYLEVEWQLGECVNSKNYSLIEFRSRIQFNKIITKIYFQRLRHRSDTIGRVSERWTKAPGYFQAKRSGRTAGGGHFESDLWSIDGITHSTERRQQCAFRWLQRD